MNPKASNEAGQLPDVAALNEALEKLGKHFLLSRKTVLAGARESLNKLGGNDYLRRFELVNTALNASANESPAIKKFGSLMNKDFREFTDREPALNDIIAYHSLERVLDEMEVYATNPSLYRRTIGGIGGGFSSGKSAFINSLLSSDTAVKLAEGIRPVTAIPSYVLSNPHTAIQGINKKGASFDIALDIYSGISHELLKELPYLRDILPYIIVSAPMSSNELDNLAFIDTPGYNPSAVGLAENDPETAREYIKDASFLIWMVGLDSNGTIPQSDLEFLSKLGFGQTEERQLYVIANKAELKPASDIEDILDTFEECLDDYDLQYAGITAYSAKMKKVFSSRGKELFEFLAENNVKRNHCGNLFENLYSAFRPYVEEIYRDDQEKKQYRKATQDLLLEALKTGAINAETDSRLEQGLSALERKFVQPEKLEDRLERVAILFDHFVRCVETFGLEVGMDKLDVSRRTQELFTKPTSQTAAPILPPSSDRSEAKKIHKKTPTPVPNRPLGVAPATTVQRQTSNRFVMLIALIGAGLGGFYLGNDGKPAEDTTATAIVTKAENPQPPLPQTEIAAPPAEKHPTQPDVQLAPVEQEQSTTKPVSPAGTVKLQLVTSMLQAATEENWNLADMQSVQLKMTSASPERGDRKVARAANAEGLQAMQQNNIPVAIDAFTRGFEADASDIEIRNNLGYAYIQAKDFISAVNTLTDVLSMAPERSSAWANLSDVFARSNLMPAAEASLRLTVHYSTDRQKTAAFLQKTAESHEVDNFKEIAGRVLQKMDSIPHRQPPN